MSKYNKAQRECIDHWIEYPGAITKRAHLEMFIEEFMAIDPAVDSDYEILFKDAEGQIQNFTHLTREEAERELIKALEYTRAKDLRAYRANELVEKIDGTLWKLVKNESMV